MVADNNGINWKAVIVLAVFCLLAGLGGGFTVKNVLYS